jgi:hypothetical protein
MSLLWLTVKHFLSGSTMNDSSLMNAVLVMNDRRWQRQVMGLMCCCYHRY